MHSTLTVYSTVALLVLLLFHLSEEAYLSEFGTFTPCIAPCTDYGIVITPREKADTLSIFVYKFNLRKGKQLEPQDVKKMKTNPSEVSIDYDKVFSNNASITTYLFPLVKAAEKVIPRDHLLLSPIFFSFDEKTNALNSAAWFRLQGEINLMFANKTVPFLAGPFSVFKNNAEEEALFKWQLINFLSGSLSNSTKTVGVLSFNGEMGSEISFEKRILDKSVTSVLTVKGISHAIVTSSFFKRGDTLPLSKYFRIISSTRTQAAVIESPCGPKGVKKKFKGLRGVKWIVGTGDVVKCRSIILRHLLSVCDMMNGCAYLTQPIKAKIIGYPNVGQTMKKLGYKGCVKNFTPAKLDAAIRRVCGGKRIPAKKRALANANTVGKTRKGGENNSQIISECINGNFLYLMLTEGYKLKDTTSIQIKKEMSGLGIDTSIGELLTKMSLLA